MKLRDDYAKLELKYSNQKNDIENLTKENNQLSRTKEDLEEKIDKLVNIIIFHYYRINKKKKKKIYINAIN